MYDIYRINKDSFWDYNFSDKDLLVDELTGNTLKFDDDGIAVDEFDGSRYKIIDDKLEVI